MTSYKISLYNIIGSGTTYVPIESGMGDILNHLKKLGKVEIIVDQSKTHCYKPKDNSDAYNLYQFIVKLASNREKSYRCLIKLIDYER